jgi:hypothetical protein
VAKHQQDEKQDTQLQKPAEKTASNPKQQAGQPAS